MVKTKNSIKPEIVEEKSEGSPNKKQIPKSFPIIAIGGSAGSFSAYEKFFSNLPEDSGMAVVIVMHLDPFHKSELSGVLQSFTSIPVIEAVDGITVKPDHIYVIPPNKDMGIHNKKLLLMTVAKPNGMRQPIDYFFQSLANDQWNKSVAVILSGMGSDGETGIRMIKENLGLTIVQTPETADYDSMPLAAIGTNLVDYVLAPEEMPLKIIQYLNHPAIAEEAATSKISVKDNNALQKILMLLRSHTGNDFALYKKNTIARRIDRRVAFNQLLDYSQYADFLTENSEEIESLFNELLIGVTKFFRDPAAFESLKYYIKELVRNKKDDKPFRVWIPGCSTGEEAYSVAILILETISDLKRKNNLKIQIYATDLDANALEHARAGLYHDHIAAEMSAERLKLFFSKDGQDYRVRKELRDIIVFAQQNLIKDPPYIKLDLLCCRNLLIYFTSELQKKIIPLFYYSLNYHGIMFMGPAETIGGFTDMFKSVDPKWKIFSRLEGNVTLGSMIDFPIHSTRQTQREKPDETKLPEQKRSISEVFNRSLISKLMPAAVLVNEKGDILYNNGGTAKFLELPRGETAINNILRLARPELKYTISRILQQAIASDDAIKVDGIILKEDNASRNVNVRAVAVNEPEMQKLVLFSFEDHGLTKTAKKRGISSTKDTLSKETEDLKKELLYTKQQLSTTIEQMEGSLERLSLSNEELQSKNEELQSTNEESLTTKEEMQSLNEELMTVNSQYQSKTAELTRLNNDMKNLLDATQVCTLFLDNDLKILRFTPQVRLLFNLISSDVGRPISDVSSNFEQPINDAIIKEVIDTLNVRVIDVKTKSNEWYRVRIMPYRTLDNYISGAVLTLTLITDYKQMQSNLEVFKNYLASLLTDTPETILQIDKDLNITGANTAAQEFFKSKGHELIGRGIDELFRKQWKTEEPVSLIKQSLNERQEKNSTIKVKTKKSEVYQIQILPFFEPSNTTPLIILKINGQRTASKND